MPNELVQESRAGIDPLAPYGWTNQIAARFGEIEEPSEPGRIVRVDRASFEVATRSGLLTASASSSTTEEPVAVGDWVTIRPNLDGGASVVSIVPRTTAIVRRDPSPGNNRNQVLAANLDYGFILYRLDRDVTPSILERYLVLVGDSGATPVVVLTKSDLVPMETAQAVAREVAGIAREVHICVASGIDHSGLDELARYTAVPNTIVVLGESGVGKSTLTNALAGSEVQSTGLTRDADGAGRHTTTSRQLVPIGNGAVLIDTPGLRSVGLTAQSEGLSQVFADIEELMQACKFNDCSHNGETGCAVDDAITLGELEQRRFDSYVKIRNEQERLAEREGAIARRAERKAASRKRSRSRQQGDRNDEAW